MKKVIKRFAVQEIFDTFIKTFYKINGLETWLKDHVFYNFYWFDNAVQNLITQDAENKATGVNEKVYVPAKYLMSISRGRQHNKSDAVDDGKYTLFTGGKHPLKINEYAYDCKSIIISKCSLIDNLNIHYVCDENFDANMSVMVHHHFDEKKIIPKFFYYFVQEHFSNYARSLGIAEEGLATNSSIFQNFPVWLPSLKQQREIVDFLDGKIPVLKKMKEKLHKLNKELTKYEDSMSATTDNFDNLIKKACKTDETASYEKIPAKYLMLISRGKKTKADAVDNGKYILFTGGKDFLKTNTYSYCHESIIISRVNCMERLNMSYVCNENFDATKSAMIHHNFDETKIIPKFFYYFAKSNFANYSMRLGVPTASVPKTSLENFQNFLVWVPSLEKQRKIIDFLDQKSTICNKIKNKVYVAIEQLNKYESWIVNDQTSNPY